MKETYTCPNCGKEVLCGIFHSIAHLNNCEASKVYLKVYNHSDIMNAIKEYKPVDYNPLDNMTQPMRDEIYRIMKEQFKNEPKLYTTNEMTMK